MKRKAQDLKPEALQADIKKPKNDKKEPKVVMEENKLTIIHNADKKWHETWTEGQNLCNIPHPFRAILCGTPGCGKTSTAQNILIRQDPPFKKLIIVHVDKDYSEEWDNCEPTEIIATIPDYKRIDGIEKTLIVFEDFEINGLDKDKRRLMSRLFGYCSTHKNCSLIVCQQDPSAVPPLIRRLSNLFVLWKGTDMKVLDLYGSKMGLKKGDLTELFTNCPDIHDSIWLDLTPGTPAAIRKNAYEVLTVS
jgi:hypothetical protein